MYQPEATEILYFKSMKISAIQSGWQVDGFLAGAVREIIKFVLFFILVLQKSDILLFILQDRK